MDKLKLAHDWYMKHSESASFMDAEVEQAWKYADAMHVEAEERNKAEAAQKRKEIREMLNAPNTFVEREGQHFDDMEEWQPDWSQAPKTAIAWKMQSKSNAVWIHKKSLSAFEYNIAPSFGYQGNWQDSLRKRPEALCEVDWRVAPKNAFQWQMINNEAYWRIEIMGGLDTEPAPSFGFTGTHIVERPHGF